MTRPPSAVEKTMPTAARRARPALRLSLQFADARHRGELKRADVARWIRAALTSDAEIAVRIVDVDEGRELNRQYRGQDHATNVLTFPYASAPALNADLVLCAPVVEREAKEQGIALAAHYAHLLVHGTLHAQGFDHDDETEAAAMEARERQIPGRPRRRRSLRALSAQRLPTSAGCAAATRFDRDGHITEAIAKMTNTIAAPSCQCSVSPSHHAPETTPSTGIIITDMLEAIGGRFLAMISQIGCEIPKIRTAL